MTDSANPEFTNKPARPRAARCVRSWLLLLAVFLIGLGVDLLSKDIAFRSIWTEPVVVDRDQILYHDWHPPAEAEKQFLPKLLHFKLVINRGAVFGIGPGQRWFFVVFTVLAITVGVLVFALKTRRGHYIAQIAIALILAGAAGNLYDRIMFAAVRDFINMFPGISLPWGLNWPGGNSDLFPWVYNIADVMLLCGIGVLLLRAGGPEHQTRKDANEADSPAEPATEAAAGAAAKTDTVRS